MTARTKRRLLGAVLSFCLAAVAVNAAVDRWGLNVVIVLSGFGAALLMEGTGLIAAYLANQEQRERAELYRGETRAQ